MIFSYDFTIGLDDVDKKYSLKDKSILRFLENVACFHSDSVGRGLGDIAKHGKAWALLEWQVKILNRPKYGDKIKVETWGRKLARTYVYRDFLLYSNGEPAVYASSKWFHLDLDKRMPVRISAEDMEPYKMEDRSILGIDVIERISELESYDTSSSYTIRKSDIDMLGHLHNTNYLDMIYEALDDDKTSNISEIRISYKKEIPYGKTVTIKTHEEDGKIHVAFTSKDGSVLNALAELC